MGYQRSSEASMWENPYADILVNSGLNRALAIHAEMIPILSAFIRVLSAFISVTGFLLRFLGCPNQR